MDELISALTNSDVDRLQEVLDKIPNVPQVTRLLLNEGISLVSELCKLGCVKLLINVLESGVSIYDANKQENLICIACKYGQYELLEYLLIVDEPKLPLLPDGIEAWHDSSPFYIASRDGKYDVLKKLYAHSPELVKQDDVRASLLYAACQGGSVECFKLWLSPAVNINSSISLIQDEKDFGNFEKNTMLYAICKGGHRELLLYILDNFPSLELNQTSCREYPDMIGEFVQHLFTPVKATSNKVDAEDEVFQMVLGNLKQKNLHFVHPSWLLPYTVTLQHLDISNNSLTELPNIVPWAFQNLVSLNVSQNSIKYISGPNDQLDGIPVCPSLKEINLSNNKLESLCVDIFCIPSLTVLNLSHNKLAFLVKSIHQDAILQGDKETMLNRHSLVVSKKEWCCDSLKTLDISHNVLQMVPSEIHRCKSLQHLRAQNNCLTTFPQPWECQMETLNLSENQLERFPVDTEKYWCSTLKYLNISHNRLNEINEGVVRLSVLADLIASDNKIERLPAPDVWECGHLHTLNLQNNKLGQPTEKSPSKIKFTFKTLQSKNRLSLSTEDGSTLCFPEVLASCLKELRLANNNLDCVPPSMCNLKMLEVLDLSENPLIKTLPIELGKLKNCGMLKLKGMNIDNVKDFPDDVGIVNRTKSILNSFMEKLRDHKEYNKIKTIVLGKKDKGKTTLVNILANKKGNSVPESRSITREEVIPKRKASFPIMQGEKKSEVKLNVWDIAGDDSYTLIHHSLFTKHTLYLLVWDFWSIESEMEQIGKWLNNIQATSQYYSIVLIGTFVDRQPIRDEELRQREELIRQELDRNNNLSHPPRVCAVDCISRRGIEDLRNTINEVAHSMKLPGRRGQPLVTRKVPKSYLDLEKVIGDKTYLLTLSKKPPVITQTEFRELLENVQDNYLLSSEETANVTKFLCETGSLLHFCDQIGALNTLYFLDPAWFCDVLVHILIDPEGKRKLKEGTGKISKADVVKIYEKDPRFPDNHIDQYIEMLERFEIAVTVDNSQKMDKHPSKQKQWLFFPCQLPENPPLCDPYDKEGQYKKICRLYRMAECPSGFWTRLLTRMMTRVEHFSSSQWYFQPLLSQSVRKMTIRNPSFKDLRNSSTYHGLHLKKPTKTFCREWIHVQHEEGSFCVEPLVGAGDEGFDEDHLQSGILITEVDKTEKFGVIGIIVDEVEDIIHDFYPGLLEPDERTMKLRLKRYALCAGCYCDKAMLHHATHFSMEHCARMMVDSDYIVCPQGHQYRLETLVPDLLMRELPDKFILDMDKLKVQETEENSLGGGVAGSVYKGTYGDRQIAVKIYRSDIRHNHRGLTKTGSYASTGSDSGTATISTQGSIDGVQNAIIEDDERIYANFQFKPTATIDLDEAESIKAFKALKEMRQEVALTSRLQHPCIISLVGISFMPKLMMALELAPLGSLRTVLNQYQNNRPVYKKFMDKGEFYPPIFDKELTFKFVYQIAKGLDYLHSHGIIYKDLKSDNILTMSLNLDDLVNVKLSDYGISKYSWGGRSVGLVGTPGYQAPEILDGLPYDEKVDIFSLSMVIYEILTANRPYMEYDNVGQISKAIKTDGKRPNLNDFRVQTNFPYMEDLMMRCWQMLGSDRPAASSIVKKTHMQNAQFLLQRSSTTFDAGETLTYVKDAVFGASNDPNHSTLWIWEGSDAERCFTVIDLEKSCYRFKKSPFPGHKVVCMCIVDKQIWIGTENNTIEVCGAETGQLQCTSTINLDGMPVHILYVSQKSLTQRQISVYVALKEGTLLKYESKSGRRNAVRRQTIRNVEGFSDPKTCTLRSTDIYCMTLTNQNKELWVSHSSYIDVVSCDEFKVKSDSRINMPILNAICGINTALNVCEMASNDTKVFCLLELSPIVLEFNCQGECVNIFDKMKDRSIMRVNVCRQVQLSEEEHEAYHGNLSHSNRNSTNSVSSTESTDDDIIDDVTNRFESSVSFWRDQSKHGAPAVPPRVGLTNRQEPEPSCSGLNNDTTGTNNQQLVGVNAKPRNSSLNQAGVTRSCNNTDKLSPSDIQDNVPSIPPRSPVVEKHPPSDAPPRPPKPNIAKTSVSDTDSKPPPRPPKPNNINRKETIYTRQNSRSFNEDDVVPPPRMTLPARPMTLFGGVKEKMPLKKQSSTSLPNFPRSSVRSGALYDFYVSSIQIVEDTLWAGRSYGDICVIDINSDKTSGTYGQVVALMRDLNDKGRNCINKEPKLVKVANCIASAFTKDDDETEVYEVASWDCKTTYYIRKVERFWTDLHTMEKNLADDQAGKSEDTAAKDIGQF